MVGRVHVKWEIIENLALTLNGWLPYVR